MGEYKRLELESLGKEGLEQFYQAVLEWIASEKFVLAEDDSELFETGVLETAYTFGREVFGGVSVIPRDAQLLVVQTRQSDEGFEIISVSYFRDALE